MYEEQNLIPLHNIMTCIFGHEPHVVLPGKFDSCCNMICFCCIDSVYWKSAQLAQGVGGYRTIDRGTSFSNWIGISDRPHLLERRIRPLLTNFLTELSVLPGTRVTCLGNGLIGDELPVDRRIEGIPGWKRRPAVVSWILSNPLN